MNEAKERAAFERYFSDGGKSPRTVERDAKGDYRLMQAYAAWRVWQARASLEPRDDPACFGVACPKHAECARYHAIETAPAVTIDSCQRGNTWPMFIQRKEAEE